MAPLHSLALSRPGELADAGTSRRAPTLHLHLESTGAEDAVEDIHTQRSSHDELAACRVMVALPGHTAPRVSATTNSASRSRARASSRRASPSATPRGTSASTRLTPSSRAATTVAQRAGGTRRTTANRSSATPASAAASGPRVASTSTAAAHSPSAVTAAASSKPTVVAPAPGRPVTRNTEPACQRGAGDEVAQLTPERHRPLARQHHRRRTPRHLVQVGAGFVVASGKVGDRHHATLSNVCSIRQRAVDGRPRRRGTAAPERRRPAKRRRTRTVGPTLRWARGGDQNSATSVAPCPCNVGRCVTKLERTGSSDSAEHRCARRAQPGASKRIGRGSTPMARSESADQPASSP